MKSLVRIMRGRDWDDSDLTLGEWIQGVIAILTIAALSYFIVKAIQWYGVIILIIALVAFSAFINLLLSDWVASAAFCFAIFMILAMVELEYYPVFRMLQSIHEFCDHHKSIFTRRFNYSTFRQEVKNGKIEDFEATAKEVVK